MQPTLFQMGHPDMPPTMPAAEAARDIALATIEANAEQAAPGFRERAKAFVLAYLKAGSAPGEDITDAAIQAGIVPHDRRAFGPVYMALVRGGLIRKVGTCKRRHGHGTSGGSIWALS